ncbi:TonB-dependent receptor plug domain-containing protein [Iodobacter fluviatilis]|nr:TonB-dependent receptor [Iodobacter fluviatilis]
MKAKQLAVAIALIGAGAALNVHAEEKINKVERVEVTGSSIKRIKKEGATPVETISRKAIEKTGAASVNELLKNISSMDIMDQGELTSNAPSASGSTNIKMRGLGTGDILVLLNGRRLPVSAIGDTASPSGVDVNMIPISAIERVEILKDGGSAVYGADAVGGVVNFITKKNYQGGEIRGNVGQSSRGDGTEKNFGMSGGYGDLDEQGFNVFGSFDIFKRDAILRKDRDLTKSVDFRSYGGKDGRSNFSPYGNINKGGTGQVKPCPTELLGADGKCKFDFNNSILTAYNGADRQTGMLLGTVKINDDIRAFLQGFYSKTQDHFEAQPAPDTMYTAGKVQQYQGRFMQAGPRITDRDSSMYQFVAGIEGSTNGFDWNIAAGHGVSTQTNQDSNYLDRDKFFAALESGAIDGTSTNNNQAIVDALKVTPRREGESSLSFFDAKVSGETGISLPGGALAYAVGVSATRESVKDTPDQLSQDGGVFGSIQQGAVDASRNAKAVYAELSIPVLKSLELQAAVRYDSYDSDSKASPRLAARFQPIPEVLFRASYTESFRMPTLKQLSGGAGEGAYTVETPEECAALGQPKNCKVDGYLTTGSNTALKPETGKSFNFGVVAEYGPFSGSIDWWKTEKSDVIDTPTELQAIQHGAYKYDARGILINTALQNLTSLTVEGIDTDIKFRLPTEFGIFTFSNTNSYYLTNEKVNIDNELENWNGVYNNPQWRNTFRVEADNGSWGSAIAVKTTAGFYDRKLPNSASAPIGPDVREVPSYTETDLTLSYSGFKNLKIDAAVKNLFDNMPPFSNANVNGNNSQMGFAELYSVRGRFFSLGAKYSF